MTPTLSQLLSARPKAVEAIRKSYGVQWLRSTVPEHDDAETIRDYCASEQIGSPWLDSIETLLDLIESRCVADAPLSDAEIEGMKWTRYETAVGPIGLVSFHAHDAENAANAMASHNSDIARCHREIKRLRPSPRRRASMKLTDLENQLLDTLLESVGDYFGNAGCNDFFVPNTKEGKALIAAVHAEEEPADRPKAMRGAGEINSHDWMVFDYLIKKLRTKEPADAR